MPIIKETERNYLYLKESLLQNKECAPFFFQGSPAVPRDSSEIINGSIPTAAPEKEGEKIVQAT